MSAPTKKAAAKKSPRAAKPEAAATEPELSDKELADLAVAAAPPREGEIRPVVIGKRGRRGDTEVQMVTLFELGDVEHKIPRNPSAALVLRWMLDTQEHGQHMAAQNMALTLLGRSALDELAADPEVEPEDIADIFTNIGTVFFTSDNYRKIMEASDPS